MNIVFKKLTEKDVPLYFSWCDKPHVKEKWFRPGYEPKEKIIDKISGQASVRPYVILIDNKAIGYIQSYALGEGDFKEILLGHVERAFGFDIFIGEEDYVDKGYGHQVVKVFAAKLFKEAGAKKIVVDPFADDIRAIKCYEKAGFASVQTMYDKQGTEIYLMELVK